MRSETDAAAECRIIQEIRAIRCERNTVTVLLLKLSRVLLLMSQATDLKFCSVKLSTYLRTVD